MEIRQAREEDIPAIVELLRLSLGETLMPKSEAFWRWKHMDNPFGASPVLVASENGVLVGVRAFLRWEWTQNGNILRAVRAVDTATHPDYQGRGIFRDLTMALVRQCVEQGVDFVFNTPNHKSKPGYIKMGWIEAGKLPVKLSVQRPVRIIRNFLTGSGIDIVEPGNNSLTYYLSHPGVNKLLKASARSGKVSTNHSLSYLTWRYANIPVANYMAIGFEKDEEIKCLVIARIKHTRFGRELRITDWLVADEDYVALLAKELRHKQNEWGIDYTTVAATRSYGAKRNIGRMSISRSFGPTVTVRPLRRENIESLLHFRQWRPGLGDLEIF
jgi:N-acetylglutamate synthase-like GNAT family acetyltransferase